MKARRAKWQVGLVNIVLFIINFGIAFIILGILEWRFYREEADWIKVMIFAMNLAVFSYLIPVIYVYFYENQRKGKSLVVVILLVIGLAIISGVAAGLIAAALHEGLHK